MTSPSITVLTGRSKYRGLAPWEDRDPADGGPHGKNQNRHPLYGNHHVTAPLKALLADGEGLGHRAVKDKDQACWYLPGRSRAVLGPDGFAYYSSPARQGGRPTLHYRAELLDAQVITLDYDSVVVPEGEALAERVHEYLTSRDTEHVVLASCSAALAGTHHKFHVTVRLAEPLTGSHSQITARYKECWYALALELLDAVGELPAGVDPVARAREVWDASTASAMRKTYVPYRLAGVPGPVWFRAAGSLGWGPEPRYAEMVDLVPRMPRGVSESGAWGARLEDPALKALNAVFAESERPLPELYAWAGAPCDWEPDGEGYSFTGHRTGLSASTARPLKPVPGDPDILVSYSAAGHADHPSVRGQYLGGPATYIFFRYEAARLGMADLADGEAFDQAFETVMRPLLDRVPKDAETRDAYDDALRQSVASEFSALPGPSDPTTGLGDPQAVELAVALARYRTEQDLKPSASASSWEEDIILQYSSHMKRVTTSTTNGALLLDGQPLTINGSGPDSVADLEMRIIREIPPSVMLRSRPAVHSAVEHALHSNWNRQSPFREQLLSYQWDGTVRLGEHPLPGTRDTAYHRTVLQALYRTIALRGLFPGVPGRATFVFHGVGRSGKSQLVHALVPDWRGVARWAPTEVGLLLPDEGSNYAPAQFRTRAVSNLVVLLDEHFQFSQAGKRGSIPIDSAKSVMDAGLFEARAMREDDTVRLGRRGYTLCMTTNYPNQVPDDGFAPGLYPDLALCTRIIPAEFLSAYEEGGHNSPEAEALHRFLHGALAELPQEQLLAEAVTWVLDALAEYGLDTDALLADPLSCPQEAEKVALLIEAGVPLRGSDRARQLLHLQQRRDQLPVLESLVLGLEPQGGRVRLTRDAARRMGQDELADSPYTAHLWCALRGDRLPEDGLLVDVPAGVQDVLRSEGVHPLDVVPFGTLV